MSDSIQCCIFYVQEKVVFPSYLVGFCWNPLEVVHSSPEINSSGIIGFHLTRPWRIYIKYEQHHLNVAILVNNSEFGHPLMLRSPVSFEFLPYFTDKYIR